MYEYNGAKTPSHGEPRKELPQLSLSCVLGCQLSLPQTRTQALRDFFEISRTYTIKKSISKLKDTNQEDFASESGQKNARRQEIRHSLDKLQAPLSQNEFESANQETECFSKIEILPALQE